MGSKLKTMCSVPDNYQIDSPIVSSPRWTFACIRKRMRLTIDFMQLDARNEEFTQSNYSFPVKFTNDKVVRNLENGVDKILWKVLIGGAAECVQSLLYIVGDVFAIKLLSDGDKGFLVLHNILQDEVLMVIANVYDYLPFGTDQKTGEVGLLLYHTDHEVCSLDTRKLKITKLMKFEEKITCLRVNAAGNILVLTVVLNHNQLRFMRYSAPRSAYD